MDEKKITKISVSTFFLIIAIIVMIVMSIFMFKFYNEKNIETQKAAELQSQVSNLNGTVSELQGKINSISNTINTDNSIETSSNSVETNTSAKEEMLYDYNKKISIICPKEWKFVYPDIDGGELHIETVDSSTNKYVGINVNSYENVDNETLEEHLNNLAEGYDNYNKTKINGIDAIIYNNKSQIKYGECVAKAFFIKDGWIYDIGYYSNDENLFDKHYSTFEGVLATVELY